MKISRLISSVAVAFVMGACVPNEECHIHGTLPSEKYDGNYIFLVPIYNTDSIGVDSTKVVGNQFEFVTKKHVMADIRLAYRVRYGTQNLLVVTEPGDVYASIDSISKGWGTAQNDSLQMWKELTEAYRKTYRSLTRAAYAAKKAEDLEAYGEIMGQANVVREDYMKSTHRIAENMNGSVLGDFLNKQFPKKD